jgi:3-dehydroquinate synthetase
VRTDPMRTDPMRIETIRLGDRDVPYAYGAGCAPELAALVLAHSPAAILMVLDGRVAAHAAPVLERLRERRRVVCFVIEAGERHKALGLVEEILEFAAGHRIARDGVVVAMGGGMTGNVAGMVAALLYRGVELIHLPTTPVAAFDSVLSLKQGVNLSHGKNLCGTFLAPALVAYDLRWLAAMPRADLLTGLAEMAKNVLAVVPEREDALLRAMKLLAGDPVAALAELGEIGVAAKVPVLARDSYEKHEALVFEYGHTVGHAVEFASEGRIGHGAAVAWGLLAAAEVSRMLGRLGNEEVAWHYRLLAGLGLPAPRAALGSFPPGRLAALLAGDNKRGHIAAASDEIPMVLLDGPGRPALSPGGHPLVPVPAEVVMAAVGAVIASADSGLARASGL